MPEHLGDAQIITFLINWIHDPLGFDNCLGNSQNVKKCYTYSFITKYKGQGASQEALVIKNPPANVGDIRDMGLIPGMGRSPGGGHGNPLQYSCLENPHRQMSLTMKATVHGVQPTAAGYGPWGCEESDMTEMTQHAHIKVRTSQ